MDLDNKIRKSKFNQNNNIIELSVIIKEHYKRYGDVKLDIKKYLDKILNDEK